MIAHWDSTYILYVYTYHEYMLEGLCSQGLYYSHGCKCNILVILSVLLSYLHACNYYNMLRFHVYSSVGIPTTLKNNNMVVAAFVCIPALVLLPSVPYKLPVVCDTLGFVYHNNKSLFLIITFFVVFVRSISVQFFPENCQYCWLTWILCCGK